MGARGPKIEGTEITSAFINFIVFEKTKVVRDLIDNQNLNVDVEIDGGINFENCSKAKNAGANILVSGSTIFKENKGNLKKNIEILRND